MKTKTIVKFKRNEQPNINKVVEIVRGGRIFSAEWEKDSGENRKGIFRTGVKKGVTGKGFNFNPFERGLLPVYDMKKGFRFIRVKNLISITANGIKYEWHKVDIWADGGEIDQRINKVNELTKFINKV